MTATSSWCRALTAGRCPTAPSRRAVVSSSPPGRRCWTPPATTEAAAYAISASTESTVTLTYILDGGHTPTIRAGAHKHLPPNAGWLPLSELHEPPPIVQYAFTGRLTLARQTGHLADITRAWTIRSIGPDNDGELWILDGGTHDTVPDATEDTHPHTRWAPITSLTEDQAIQEALEAADADISIQLPAT